MLFLILISVLGIISADNVSVCGVLACNGKPVAGVHVQMHEYDWDPDDSLGSAISKSNGQFEIRGEESEVFGKIEPYITIEHTCNETPKGCKRVARYYIPNYFINKMYNMTTVILDTVSDEKLVCS